MCVFNHSIDCFRSKIKDKFSLRFLPKNFEPNKKLPGYASNPMISKILSPSTDVTELNDNAQHLPQLNEKFISLIKGRSLPILSFYEEKPINAYGQGMIFVTGFAKVIAKFIIQKL